MAVTLIGYRGTGKSAVAPHLAALWGWEWIDADVELERRAGRSIQEIFATDGEPVFRTMERELLKELLQSNRLTIAAGGGAILSAETRKRMRTSGPVIWLRATVATIAQRIAQDTTTAARRPKLTAQGGVAEIRKLLAIREPFYASTSMFSITVDTDPPEIIATKIAATLRSRGWAATRVTP